MNYIVYQTINIKNNKIYIGVHKTRDPNVFDGYIGCGIYINNPSTYMHPITPLQAAVKKYGTSNFKRTTIKIFNNSEEAYQMEKDLVTQEFINRGDTYNAKLGGLGGASYYRKVYQFSPEGTLIRKWDSIVEASDFLGVSHTAVSNAIKYRGSCKSFLWSETNTIDISQYTLYTGSVCYKYNSLGEYLETYNSIHEAALDNNLTSQQVQRAVKGGYKTLNFYFSTKLYDNYKGGEKCCIINRPIYVYNLGGEFLIELNGKNEILKYFNIKSISSITVAIRCERPYKDYQISLEKVQSLPPKINKRNISKKVGRYSIGGELLQEFKSITEACKQFGTGVQKVLRGQQQQCKGFIFRYIS